MPGYGSGFWGDNPWGDDQPEGVSTTVLLSVLAISENVIRAYFSAPVLFTGLLDEGDASDPSHYLVTPVLSTTGADGNPPQTVSVLFATIGTEPASIDLTLDRAMTPFPAQYEVAISGLIDATTFQNIATASAVTPALYRVLLPANENFVIPSRDFANPNSFGDFADPVSPYANTALLGTLQYDDTGDYALDEGVASYKKRVLRRGITNKNGFAHLPGYGVGIPSYGKKLASASTRAKLAADWQSQILQEPETLKASVDSHVDPSNPGLVFFVVKAVMKQGKTVNFKVPVSIGATNG